MSKTSILERYLQALLSGNRASCRSVIEDALHNGMTANQVYMDIIWPMMIEIERLKKTDVINTAQEALATRINRTIIDQLQNKLPRTEEQNKKIAICSALDEHAELGAQMIADLFESAGWDVRFLGGSVDNDDIISYVHCFSPDVLLVYGIGPKRAPEIRQLIDTIRGINAWPDMKIMLSGGIFDRAEGLWEEIGADLYAPDPSTAVRIVNEDSVKVKKPTRTINRRKKKTQQSELEPALS